MKILVRDNQNGKVFEYGSDKHHALRISENGGCLVFEHLQCGDGSSENGRGGFKDTFSEKIPIEDKRKIKFLSWKNAEEWGKIECPMLEGKMVMTYCHKNKPCYYSYTAPIVENGEVFYYRFDHDEGCWDEDCEFDLGEYKGHREYMLE